MFANNCKALKHKNLELLKLLSDKDRYLKVNLMFLFTVASGLLPFLVIFSGCG